MLSDRSGVRVGSRADEMDGQTDSRLAGRRGWLCGKLASSWMEYVRADSIQLGEAIAMAEAAPDAAVCVVRRLLKFDSGWWYFGKRSGCFAQTVWIRVAK